MVRIKKDTKLGAVFVNIAFAVAWLVTIALLIDLVGGGGLNLWLVGAGVLAYAAYFIAAIRAGESPGRYIRFVGRGGQPPL